MFMRAIQFVLVTATVLAIFSAYGEGTRNGPAGRTAILPWQEKFDISKCKMVTTGRNPYFVLEPGFQLVLEGDDTKLQITVLDETKTVDGVVTRVVEEREWKGGELYEVARNYFAMCEHSKDVYYFGEDVDFYEKGKVVKHDGSWLAGQGGNRAGLMMPGKPAVGMRYYQEIAPGVAMDRAEIVSLEEKCKTPAGTFANCMQVKEGSAIDVLVTEYKYHAPDIGLVRDEDLRLVKHGFIKGK
jgi:hypothetical protein